MRRLSLSLLLVVITSIIGAGWAMDRLFARLDQGEDDTLQMAEQFGYRLVDLLDGLETLPADSPVPLADGVYDIQIVSRDSLMLPAVLDAQLAEGRVVMLQSIQGVTLYFLLPDTQRIIALGIPEQYRSGTALRLLLTIVFYGSIILLVLVWLYPLIRRLQTLATATRLIGEGDLSQRIDTNKRSQLHNIECEFNAMAQRIQVLLEDNKMLSSAVSHDLRTPLARLRFGVDALAETQLDDRQSDYIGRLSADLDGMEQLVSVLLEFARLEQRLDDLPCFAVSLAPIVGQAVERVAPGDGREFELDVRANIPMIQADERYTLMLVNNLVQNAVKFSASKVKLSADKVKGLVILRVEDDGAGFSDVDVERLLKPFQKGVLEGGSAGAVCGYGLGLAIVERIARWQSASISLGKSQSLGGACVTVGFRIAEGKSQARVTI